MTSLTRAHLRSTLIHAVLLVVLAFWMVPQIYMLSIGLRTPAQAFDPALITLPITFEPRCPVRDSDFDRTSIDLSIHFGAASIRPRAPCRCR